MRRAGGYVLTADEDAVDLWSFRRLVAAAGAAKDEQVNQLLRSALGLWRGEALAGLNGQWPRSMRQTLEEQKMAAILDLNDLAMRQGRYNTLISELTDLAGDHPTDERLAGQLMLALYRSGRQADALQCFERTRHHLDDEFGAHPGPELRSLHEQILRNDASLNTPVAVNGRSATRPRQLPADVPGFTGRAAELAELDRLLSPAEGASGRPAQGGPASDNKCPAAVVISAVSGTAGVGKTALALRWAHSNADQFPDGQLYVNLRGYDPGPPMPATDALAGFLRALGMPGQDIPAETEERAARYRSLLAGRRI